MTRNSTKAKGLSRKVKAVLFLPLLVLWLGLMLVGLEAYSRLSEAWSQRHNPYIMGQKRTDLPMPTGVPIVLDGFRWDQQHPNPKPGSPSPSDAACTDAAWPQCFEALGPMQRHLAAGRHDAAVFELDKAGRLVEIWGIPLEKEFLTRAGRGLSGCLWRMLVAKSGFHAGVSEALRGAAGKKPIALPWMGVLCAAEFRPIPATGGVFVFCPNLVGGARRTKSLPPDTPWDVLFFRYKKGVPNPRWGLPGTCFLNNAGFRGKNIEIPKPARCYRILCLGGSTTEEGSADDNTYPALLEKKLSAAFPGHPIEVVNCGISGLQSAAQLMRFSDYLALEPDLFVVYEGVNDAASILPMHWLLFDSPLWIKAAYGTHFFRRRLEWLPYCSDKKIKDDVQAFILGRFRIMREWALANKAEIAFCSVASPPLEELPFQDREYIAYRTRGFEWAEPPVYLKNIRAMNAGLKELSETEGWGYLPVAENFHYGLGCFGDICHMCPEGIERKAEVIFQCLKIRLASVFNPGQ